MPKKLTQEQFLEKCNRAHGDKYDYSKTKYINSRTKVTIICPKHGEFQQLASDHCSNIKSYGCYECGRELTAKKLIKNRETVIKDFVRVHGNNYDYSKMNYIDCDTYITIICPKHGEFK